LLASYWFIIYYRHVMYGNSNRKKILSLLGFQPLIVHAMGYSANRLHSPGSPKWIRILHNGGLCKTGVERLANAAGLLSERYPSFFLHFRTLCDGLYPDSGLQTLYSAWPRVSKMLGRTQKKKLHSMQFGVQTRLFKLVSCEPEDSDFLHDETRSWWIREEKTKRRNRCFLR